MKWNTPAGHTIRISAKPGPGVQVIAKQGVDFADSKWDKQPVWHYPLDATPTAIIGDAAKPNDRPTPLCKVKHCYVTVSYQ
jgi:hypothetical protein